MVHARKPQHFVSLHPRSPLTRALASFVSFLEKRLGGRFIYDASKIPFGREDLIGLFELAEKLKRAGVIESCGQTNRLYDEPPLKLWRANLAMKRLHVSSGIAVGSDRAALTAALAEALERYLWFEATDYFDSPTTASTHDMRAQENVITPERFAGFSEEQREKNPKLTLRDNAAYLWIRGYSWVKRKPVWIPAQVISGFHGSREAHKKDGEPTIISTITTGLATGQTRTDALLGGALEIIERDAFMITWMNHLSPPLINVADAAKDSQSLTKLLSMCSRYRLSAQAILHPTDVPAYAVCAVVKDDSETGAPLTIGLNANRNLAHAIEKSLLEALRMRQNVRRRAKGKQATEKQTSELNHMERVDYWAFGDRYKTLSFLTDGKQIRIEGRPWDNDTPEEHWERILLWCRDKNYECASVDLGVSEKNVSPWHIHMVVMPELQPIHQNERLIYLGGERLKSIPKQFGYKPLEKLFTDEPHPFA